MEKTAALNLSLGNLEFYGTEKSAIVIEFGSAYTKCGYAGESTPRHILPSKFVSHSGKQLVLNAALEHTNYAFSEWREALELYFNRIFYIALASNPKERRIVIVENLISSAVFIKAATDVLFKKFKVPAVCTVPSQLLSIVPLLSPPDVPATLTSSRSTASVPAVMAAVLAETPSKAPQVPVYLTSNSATGLVLDCGFMETRVLPIYEGIGMTHALSVGPLGSCAIQKNLSVLIKDYASIRHMNEEDTPTKPVMKELPSHVIEDIVVRLCYVDQHRRPSTVVTLPPRPWSFKSQQDKEKTEEKQEKGEDKSANIKGQVTICFSVPTKEEKDHVTTYPLVNADQLQLNLFVRSHAADILFDKNEEDVSVPALVLDSLLQCPPDTRCELAQNIILSGGTCMMPGFKTRLLRELRLLLRTDPSYSELKGLCKEFGFAKLPVAPNYLSWLGGSIVGSLEWSNQNSVVNKEAPHPITTV